MHGADFLAIHLPDRREWVVEKNRFSETRQSGVGDDKFEELLSDALSRWAARGIGTQRGTLGQEDAREMIDNVKQRKAHLDMF